jgi:hypothetical protein
MARGRPHPDRTAIETAAGLGALGLAGILLGFFATATHHWERPADIALFVLGLVCLIFGVYVFAQFWFDWLPVFPEPRVRRRQLPLPLQLPPFLTAQGQLNALITEGESIRKWMPAPPPANPSSTSALAQVLGEAALAPRTFKQVVGWEARAAERVRNLAPSYTSLFTTDQVPEMKYSALADYMDARLAELREILKKT